MSEFFPGLRHADNPVVFFDVCIGDISLGQLKIELFSDTCPKVKLARHPSTSEDCAQASSA